MISVRLWANIGRPSHWRQRSAVGLRNAAARRALPIAMYGPCQAVVLPRATSTGWPAGSWTATLTSPPSAVDAPHELGLHGVQVRPDGGARGLGVAAAKGSVDAPVVPLRRGHRAAPRRARPGAGEKLPERRQAEELRLAGLVHLGQHPV